MNKKVKLGPTGKYPEGKLIAEDRGELRIGLFVHQSSIVLDFGSEISWFAMNPDMARRMGEQLIQMAKTVTQNNEKAKSGTSRKPGRSDRSAGGPGEHSKKDKKG
jgi:hypothetical protein